MKGPSLPYQGIQAAGEQITPVVRYDRCQQPHFAALMGNNALTSFPRARLKKLLV